MICGCRCVSVGNISDTRYTYSCRRIKSFTVIVGDVRTIQATEQGVFQISSNFHALEERAYNVSTEHTDLNSYIYDRTQGPLAVISTVADLYYRRYLLPTGPYTDDALLAGKWQLDMLADVRREYGVNITVGGWADLSQAPLLPTNTDIFTAASMVKSVAIMDALVTHNDREIFIGNSSHRVDHILTAAYDMNMPTTASEEVKQSWANAFLLAAYVNTLKLAQKRQAKQVFLTLVGGGVFSNSEKNIYTAMAVAINTVELSPDTSIFLIVMPGHKISNCLHAVIQFAEGRISLYECLYLIIEQ